MAHRHRARRSIFRRPNRAASSPVAQQLSCSARRGRVIHFLRSHDNQYSSFSSALYQGGIFEVRRSLSNHFALLGSYTYSKGIDMLTVQVGSERHGSGVELEWTRVSAGLVHFQNDAATDSD